MCSGVCLSWAGPASVDCEERTMLLAVFWRLPLLARSGLCGLWRGHSPAGCVLRSGPPGQVWLVWAVERAHC